MTLKSDIQQLARDLNIQKIGFARADDFEYLRQSLVEQKAAGHTSGFEYKNLDERLQPHLSVADAKTIISIGIAYPSKAAKAPQTAYKRGEFARASWGIDYHNVLNKKMEQLARAGLGFIGKNGLLVSREYGSWLYLGELVTNLEIDPDVPVDYGCGDCTRCVDFCPTQALLEDGRLNAPRCLSFQTQNKGSMPEEFRPKLTKVIYGCDICQIVCPYNKGIDNHFHAEIEAEPELSQPELLPLLKLTNREFKLKFGHMAGSWRGKNPIQRNAIYALGNLHDKTALEQLTELRDSDPRDYIQEAASWAIKKINNG
jgi:epoxyqueuosine reductase